MIRLSWRRIVVLIALVVVCARASASPSVDFEDLGVGTTFGALDGHAPGELVYSQNGIDVLVEDFFFGSLTQPGFAEVGGFFTPDFASKPLSIDNLNLRFEFGNVGFPVTQVSFEYVEAGGQNNFAVNGGALIQLNPLSTLPSNIAPSVTASVEDGVVTLIGEIDSFLIGGQELGIDNIVAVPEPATLTLLTACGLSMLRRFRRKKS